MLYWQGSKKKTEIAAYLWAWANEYMRALALNKLLFGMEGYGFERWHLSKFSEPHLAYALLLPYIPEIFFTLCQFENCGFLWNY